MQNQMNLLNPAHAYFFGFVQGDGHLSVSTKNPNKGKLEIELGKRDEDICLKFQKLFPTSSVTYRHRDTNFKVDFDAVIWRLCGQDFRKEIAFLGVPTGKKSLTVKPPESKYSEVDYWRGFVDADGSLGMTGKNLPYLSLVTTSQKMAEAYEQFLFSIIGKRKTLNRNKRDKAYNITLFREDAAKIVATLYYSGCLALNRKLKKADEVLAWKRPSEMRVITQKKWNQVEDKIVLKFKASDAADILNRSKSSILNRKGRLYRMRKIA